MIALCCKIPLILFQFNKFEKSVVTLIAMYDFWNSMLLVIRRWHDNKNRKYAFPLHKNPYLTTISSKTKKKSHPVTTCLPYYLFIIR